MPRPQRRTRSMKRRATKSASGMKPTIHYKKPRVKATRCNRCGRPLSGIPVKSSIELHRLPTSKKKPQRMFGGQLCPTCLREALKQTIRSTITR